MHQKSAKTLPQNANKPTDEINGRYTQKQWKSITKHIAILLDHHCRYNR